MKRKRFSEGQIIAILREHEAGVTTADLCRKHWLIDRRFIGKGGILRTMTASKKEAYHLASVGISWSYKRDIKQMIEAYRKSILIDAIHTLASNNLAWFYAASPDVTQRDGKKAVEFALMATAQEATGANFDTLACAYAQEGNFAEAARTEERAIAAQYTPFNSNLLADFALFKSDPPRPCNDTSFGTDPSPFRPGSPAPRSVLSKMLYALH